MAQWLNGKIVYRMARDLIIGVLSDTHIPHRLPALPPGVAALLRGCDLILHAGDVEDPRILDPLRAIAPVHGVRGNVHWQYSTGTHDHDLPPAVIVPIAGHVVWLTHGHLNFGYTMLDKVRHLRTHPTLAEVNRAIISRLARSRPRQADLVVFGHTHKACAEWVDGALYYNPGAVCVDERSGEPPSLGRIVLGADGVVRPEWTVLDDPACILRSD
jgi:putative phosphoesterase